MSRILQFKEKLISFLREKEQDTDVMSWITTQPELDQPNFLRALSSLLVENFEIKPSLDKEEVLAAIDKRISDFEESILDRKLHKSMFMMEMEERITDEETFLYFLEHTRQEVITRIISDPTSKENWDFVHKIIQIEKDSGCFAPANWKVIF